MLKVHRNFVSFLNLIFPDFFAQNLSDIRQKPFSCRHGSSSAINLTSRLEENPEQAVVGIYSAKKRSELF